jgi:hypothetical protein
MTTTMTKDDLQIKRMEDAITKKKATRVKKAEAKMVRLQKQADTKTKAAAKLTKEAEEITEAICALASEVAGVEHAAIKEGDALDNKTIDNKKIDNKKTVEQKPAKQK